MGSQYERIMLENLGNLFNPFPSNADRSIGARIKGKKLYLRAFGEECCIAQDRVTLSGRLEAGPRGVLVTLYARSAQPVPIALEPFKAFKDFPGSTPYQAAFAANTERVLVPHVEDISKSQERLLKTFNDANVPCHSAGDFSLLLFPLPKIALNYIFYLADEEFPASVTCLFSSNALSFLPLDALADVAEYTSKQILELIALWNPDSLA